MSGRMVMAHKPAFDSFGLLAVPLEENTSPSKKVKVIFIKNKGGKVPPLFYTDFLCPSQ